MERCKLLIAAPSKYKGLGKEIENTKKVQDQTIFIQVEEYNDRNNLINRDQEAMPDFLLLFESIVEHRCNKEKAHTELLEGLKRVKFISSTKIVVILTAEREKELITFANELIKLDIQNFYFVSDFNIDDVIRWLLLENRELKDNQMYITTEIAAKNEKEVVIKEVPKYIEVPAENVKRKRLGFGFLSKERNTNGSNSRGVRIIGITGAERGAGVTTLCVELAGYLAQSGRVAILDKTERNEFADIGLPGISVYTTNLGRIELSKYDFVIIDFGVFFDIGKIDGIATIITEGSIVVEYEQKMSVDKSYCNLMICVCPAAPWKLYKTDFLVNNIASADDTEGWILLFNGNTNSDAFRSSSFMRKMITTYDNKNYLEEIERLI